MSQLTEDSINKLVALALEFHIKTGAPIDDIKQFIKDIGDVTADFTMNVVKDEIHRAVGGRSDN